MSLDPIKTREFRKALSARSRDELLRIVKMQDQDLYDQVMQIEMVFKEKLTHLQWSDGTTIEGRDLSNEELALLIDEPFQVQEHLLDMGINAEKQRELHAISDSVTWVKTFLRDEDGDPIAPRVYQILPMRSESHRKILRWGRRCLVAGTEVLTTKGIKKIEDITTDDMVYSEHGKPIKVLEIVPQGKQEVIEILHGNKKLAASTLDHRWLFSNNTNGDKYANPYVSTPELARKKDLCIERRFVKAPLGDISEPHAYALGALMGDGCKLSSNTRSLISSADEPVVANVAYELKADYKKYKGNNYTWAVTGIPNHNSWISGLYAHEKSPDLETLKTWDRDSLLRFVAGLIDTDGSVFTSGLRLFVNMSSQSKDIIDTYVWAVKSLWQCEPGINIDNRDKYVNGPCFSADITSNLNSIRIVKELSPYLKTERKQFKSEYDDLPRQRSESRIGIIFGAKYLAETYDISVDSSTQLYLLANEGLVTHNTGKSFYMALTMLHKAMTIPNYKVIVVAPQIKHTKILYDEVVNIIENNPYVESNVSRYIQSPSPEVNFITGSFIRFFTAGTKSAGNADSARGQEADLIILDEMDYLHPDDLVALLAMLQDTRKNKGKKILIGASTPTGAHEVFYEWCTSPKSLFTEFYFPSYVNPEWSDEMEQEMRGLYRTTNSYRHEIEADWGENAEGVYPRRYLDVAFSKDNEWEYKDHRVNKDSDFFIGVDWDKYGAGTNIVVLERYSRNYVDKGLANKFRIAFREETVREEFTYTNAVRRVIELNERFNPKFIYVDRGAGEVQVELLHEAGIANPFSGLGKKVKGISFKEIIEARDPFTKQPRRMETKPFMVDNLYQFLENELVAIPNDDNELYHQLLSYVVLRTSQNGNPVFGSLNDNPDHAHDALLLACLAFTENYGDFFNLDLATESRVVSNKFFIPMFAGEAGQREHEGKVKPHSDNPSIANPFEPPDAIMDEQVSKITRAMPGASRGSKSVIRRKSF